jgi:DNA polymerase III delta prime subunit
MIDPFSFNHHAVLLLDENRKEMTEQVWSLLSTNSLHHTNFTKTVLDIDTARAIQEWNNTAHSEPRKALISFHSITIPAQNALLKVIEEPSNVTSFILITSNENALLPTLLSRVQKIRNTRGESAHIKDVKDVELFLSTEKTKRIELAFLQELLKKTDEKERKDREAFHSFIVSLTTSPLLTPEQKEKLFLISSYARDSSSSLKAIAEYLSLYLPVNLKREK